MTPVVRDLTDDELEHAKFLARKWHRLCKGHSPFALDCEALAANGWLTRGQYEKLKQEPTIDLHPPRRSLNGRRSKRPITLAKHA